MWELISLCHVLSQHPVSTTNIQLKEQDFLKMHQHISSDTVKAKWHVTVSAVSPLLSPSLLLLLRAISEPRLGSHLNIQQTEAGVCTLTHTRSPFLSPSSNRGTHNFLCFSVTIYPSNTHTHTHTHCSLVEKWLYLCCQVCSQRWLWPQTEICSLLHHRGYNDKAAPNIYFLICPLRCNCYHLCQLSWIGTRYCWQAASCFSTCTLP